MKPGPALAAVRTLSSRAERTGLGGAGLQDSARSANIFFMRSAQGFKERTGHSAFCGVLPSDSLAPARSTEELRIKLPMWTPGLVPTKKRPVVTGSYGHYQIMRVLDMTMNVDEMATETDCSGRLSSVSWVLRPFCEYPKRRGSEIPGHHCLYCCSRLSK